MCLNYIILISANRYKLNQQQVSTISEKQYDTKIRIRNKVNTNDFKIYFDIAVFSTITVHRFSISYTKAVYKAAMLYDRLVWIGNKHVFIMKQTCHGFFTSIYLPLISIARRSLSNFSRLAVKLFLPSLTVKAVGYWRQFQHSPRLYPPSWFEPSAPPNTRWKLLSAEDYVTPKHLEV